jgi:hypothetical protein
MSEKTEQTRKIVLKKNKTIDKIWHPDSTLVFKSSEEKLVIGRLENGQVIPLDDIAVELCEEWKFKYDETLLEQSEQEGDENDEEENEEENEETQSEEPSNEEHPNQETHNEEPSNEEPSNEEHPNQETHNEEHPNKEPTSQNEVVIDSMFSALQSRVLSTILALEEKIRIQTQEMTSIKKELEDTHNELNSTKTELEDTRNKLQNIKKVLNF